MFASYMFFFLSLSFSPSFYDDCVCVCVCVCVYVCSSMFFVVYSSTFYFAI